ncbi:MAG TPA: hypothetical protein VK158_06425 [Acidobacteriota bacterium]|nr:hypothetical protein [Acidobacteriota bacterium]
MLSQVYERVASTELKYINDGRPYNSARSIQTPPHLRRIQYPIVNEELVLIRSDVDQLRLMRIYEFNGLAYEFFSRAPKRSLTFLNQRPLQRSAFKLSKVFTHLELLLNIHTATHEASQQEYGSFTSQNYRTHDVWGDPIVHCSDYFYHEGILFPRSVDDVKLPLQGLIYVVEKRRWAELRSLAISYSEQL